MVILPSPTDDDDDGGPGDSDRAAELGNDSDARNSRIVGGEGDASASIGDAAAVAIVVAASS